MNYDLMLPSLRTRRIFTFLLCGSLDLAFGFAEGIVEVVQFQRGSSGVHTGTERSIPTAVEAGCRDVGMASQARKETQRCNDPITL